MHGRWLFVAAALVTSIAAAQNYDILETAPQTAIYVETTYNGNEGRPECDWYASSDEFLAAASRDTYGPDCRISIRIRGIINEDGALAFADVVAQATDLKHVVASLVFDSKGGHADAAISMAELIRESEIFRNLPVVARIAEDYQSVCFSACVVIFSAAYERELEFNIFDDPDLPSRIGIHSPGQFDRQRSVYDSSATNSELVRLSRRLKDYFRSIGVAEKLVDDMFAIPFDDIQLLTREELISYGLYAD